MNGRSVAKIAALIAGGALIGAGVSLLYAPQSGNETRRMIRNRTKEAKFEATRLAHRVKQGVDRVKKVVAKKVPYIKAA
jgi:gas vesicle protein